jgi:hypothetical protein
MRKPVLVHLVLICFSLFAAALASAQDEPDKPKRGPSTQEERKRFVALTHKLEATPLDKGLYQEKGWAKVWLDAVPDINVTICPLVFGEDFLASRYKYAPQLSYQVTFASAVYIIEHPDKAKDTLAQYTAGVESALKAYKAILKSEPEAKSKSLDDLLEKQSQGKLAEFVREASKECDNEKKEQGL